ncbi:MAG: aminotransferase class I/II-fold pyridoxal phosphate-dependent enzyme [Hormoscilla sp. GUM202]|nr:aminotransferase class I/II-fold pyridoxal phosphate-dependent enzyme [Hormoscilla sp. GUM202]
MKNRVYTHEMIKSYYPGIKLRLHTPAHRGSNNYSEYFGSSIYNYDLPFFLREDFWNIEQSVAKLYQTEHTFFLTGGATQGILVACAILGSQHRRVAVGINSHLSIIHGFILSGIDPYFIPSQSLEPTAKEVIQGLEASPEVKALFLTNPSYQGITTDLVLIAKYCRSHQILLILDEAHGTHFPFLELSIPSGLTENIDIVVHSLHKFVGSLVQTALLHIPQYSRISVEEVTKALSMFETTSRSNLLVLSAEEAIKFAFTNEGKQCFSQVVQGCHALKKLLDNFGDVLTYDSRGDDPLKIFLISDRATGEEISDLLRERQVDYEYCNQQGVLLIFSFTNTPKEFSYLEKVFNDIFDILVKKTAKEFVYENQLRRIPIMSASPRKAFFAANKQKLKIKDALGLTSCNSIKKIPPCIPLLIPGEQIVNYHLENIDPELIIQVMQ